MNLGRWVAAYLAVHPPAAARPQHRWQRRTDHGEVEEPIERSRVGPFVEAHQGSARILDVRQVQGFG